MFYDTIIIGSGPAGMTAAISFRKSNSENTICILEHNDRPGKKILSTGNGKCNLTNMDMKPDYYHSDSGNDYYKVIENFPPQKVREFFMSMGMLTKEKKGYVYPNSEQASAVLDTLRYELERLKIRVYTEIHISKITHNSRFIIRTDKESFECSRLILACGSKCATKTGSDGSGYTLAKGFGHSIVNVIPALTQLRCNGSYFKEVSGVRCEAALQVICDNRIIASDTGELQLTDYGISGIPTFQISRFVKRLLDENKKPVIHINFMPSSDIKSIKKMLLAFGQHNQKLDMYSVMAGIFNKKLANVLLKEAGIKPSMLFNDCDLQSIDRLCVNITDFKVYPTDTNGFENAQVCAGGIALSEIDMNTMESLKCRNLFFAGEIMDVEGKCGGYNLTWAFASGYLAGKTGKIH